MEAHFNLFFFKHPKTDKKYNKTYCGLSKDNLLYTIISFNVYLDSQNMKNILSLHSGHI